MYEVGQEINTKDQLMIFEFINYKSFLKDARTAQLLLTQIHFTLFKLKHILTIIIIFNCLFMLFRIYKWKNIII